MKIRPILYFAVLLFTQSIYGQLSLTNPIVCHDKDNFLNCYNDGTYILTFGNGNFKEFKTADSVVKYSDIDKTLTFYQKNVDASSTVDTIQIIQLPKSIVFKKGTAALEVTSLKIIPNEIYNYLVGTYSIDNDVMGLSFWVGDKYFKIAIWTYGKVWHWDIIMKESNRSFIIGYNGFRHNRIEHIFIQDDLLRYGMATSMTFKTLKKIWHLESLYVDTLRTFDNGTPVIGSIQLDKNYKYEYGKKGKLKTDKIVGELKLCDCH